MEGAFYIRCNQKLLFYINFFIKNRIMKIGCNNRHFVKIGVNKKHFIILFMKRVMFTKIFIRNYEAYFKK